MLVSFFLTTWHKLAAMPQITIVSGLVQLWFNLLRAGYIFMCSNVVLLCYLNSNAVTFKFGLEDHGLGNPYYRDFTMIGYFFFSFFYT